MGKSLQWVREEPRTGRLLYRRAYPERLRSYLPEPRRGSRELKVSLGANVIMTREAFAIYERAKRQFIDDVKRAGAAATVEDKATAGVVDFLDADLIRRLVDTWKHEELSLDHEVRWTARPLETKLRAQRKLREGIQEDLTEARSLRGIGDRDAIVRAWGDTAADCALGEGIVVDRTAPEFLDFVLAIHDAAIAVWEAILRRLDGEDVPTPPLPAPSAPTRPMRATKGVETVSELLNAYKAAKWAGWSTSSRTAVEPVFRLLRDTIGDREVRAVDRAAAREVLEIVQALPARLGRRKELEGLTVPEAVEEGKRLGLETIGPGTINRGYMVHVSAIFGWAAQEERADRNPFKGLGVADPVDDRDKRDPFTLPQLQAMFASEPWDAPLPHDDAKPGRYWVPLIALFTGMRLGEAAGLRIMDVEELDGITALRLRPHEGRSLKNKESRRDVPVHSGLQRLGLLAFVEHRRRCAASAAELLFPDGKANSRGQSGAKLGEWFVSHVRKLGLEGAKLGIHSFRHGFEDRLRAIGLHGRPEGLTLTGRAVAGSEGGYGSGFTLEDLRAALERVAYPRLVLDHLERGGPQAPSNAL
jgi:integrase